MNYSKKVIVLKQIDGGFSSGTKPVNAIARIEIENGVADFFLSVINLAPTYDGNYYAFICDDTQKVYPFEIGKRPLSFSANLPDPPSVERGFCAGLCFVKDYLPTLFCFAKTDDCPTDAFLLKKKIAEHFLVLLKNQPKPITPEPTLSNCEQTTILKEKEKSNKGDDLRLEKERCDCTNLDESYDDQAVATQNYYDLQEQIDFKLDKIQEFSRELLSDKNDSFNNSSRTQESQGKTGACSIQNETNTANCQKNEELPYYLTVKDELDKIFCNFDREDALNNMFSNGKWAKINYSKDRYYVVGVIKEKDVEKYICYGVPDVYSDTPPKEFDGYCCFLPLNQAEPKGKGYWMMFQDAFSGRCVSRNINFTPNKKN